MESSLIKTFDLDFAQIEIHDYFVVSTIKEGIVFDKKHLKIFYKICNEHFVNRPFGYISNRKFDYTVNPTCYLERPIYTNLICIAILCYTEASAGTAKFEKQFYQRPMEIFFDIDKSKRWIKSMVIKKEKAGL